ncbi:hypothetical protein E4U16_001853 [Claviceps sp. LM84 group G4]|nr:hypothetical protein E4U16_001853 [Claviceps sp. LM84 group G4]
MERMCKSILTYTLCGHTKEFDRPCRENFGSNRRRCSAANRHTTRQTNDKWPCEVCRLYPRSRRRLKRKRADDDSPNVTPNGMSTLQGYINKIAHVKSVDKPTRQDGSDLIRHRLPIGSSFLERTETLKNHWFNYDTKDDINKDQQVKSVDDPTRQQRGSSILAEEPLEDNQLPLPQLPLPQLPLPQMTLPQMTLPPQMPLPGLASAGCVHQQRMRASSAAYFAQQEDLGRSIIAIRRSKDNQTTMVEEHPHDYVLPRKRRHQ